MRARAGVRVAHYALLALTAFVLLFPIFWMVLGAFKTNTEHLSNPPVIMPSQPWEAVVAGFQFISGGAAIPVGRLALNSIVITVGSLALSLFLAVLAAYGFARFRVGGLVLPFTLLAFRMVPPIAMGLPIFVIFRSLRLLDTHLGMIIALSSFMVPITIWLLRGFLLDTEVSLEEAAMVDGANRWQVLFKITLPLIAPGLAAVTLLGFTAAWNEFFYAILLTRQEAATLPAAIPFFLPRELAPGQPMSGSFLLALFAATPVVILALALQRYLVSGLTMGSVK